MMPLQIKAFFVTEVSKIKFVVTVWVNSRHQKPYSARALPQTPLGVGDLTTLLSIRPSTWLGMGSPLPLPVPPDDFGVRI